MEPKTNAVVKLVGTDGNALAIISKVKTAIKRSDHPELAAEFQKEAMSGDYDHVLQTCMVYVDIR
jgi:hypothetical protein